MTALGILSVAHPHAWTYAELLADMDGVTLAGVAETDADRRERVAGSEYDLCDRDALLDAVDGVVICSTNAARGTWLRPAADAGVAVLAEKPLAVDAGTARELADYCRERDVGLGLAMPLRHSVPAREANRRLEAGAIGEVQAIAGTNRGQFPGGWFADPDAAGGGAVMDHTVHIVDLVRWLTGERVTEVYAETASRLHDIDVEDCNLLSMTLADGTQFSLDGSWSKPDAYRFWGDATVEVVGTEGTVAMDCFDETFTRTRDVSPDRGAASVFWGDDPNERMLKRFVERVRTDVPPAAPASAGVEAVAVVEAAYESADTGRPVAVEY